MSDALSAGADASAARPGVIVVTGASRGIGAAIARGVARDGYATVINYSRDAEGAAGVVAEIEASGGRAAAFAADVARDADVAALFAFSRTLGPLAGLVNNAAITGASGRVAEVTTQTLSEVFATNVIGAFVCARAAIPLLATSRGHAGGSIVNISSLAARLGGANEWVHYAASKGALDTFTRGLALELASDGIRVNAVAPGLIETGMHAASVVPDRLARFGPSVPLGRVGTPDEVADVVCWLLSSRASYVTGAIVEVGGGR